MNGLRNMIIGAAALAASGAAAMPQPAANAGAPARLIVGGYNPADPVSLDEGGMAVRLLVCQRLARSGLLLVRLPSGGLLHLPSIAYYRWLVTNTIAGTGCVTHEAPRTPCWRGITDDIRRRLPACYTSG